ncbi:MAG: hypothetical protein AAFR61_29790 [Bacteroidota bacterium]
MARIVLFFLLSLGLSLHPSWVRAQEVETVEEGAPKPKAEKKRKKKATSPPKAKKSSPKKPKRTLAEAYILTFAGDTVRGMAKLGNSFQDQRFIRFIDNYGVKVKYTADRIKGFGYDSLTYDSHPTPYLFAGLGSDSAMFFQRLISGPAKLYRFYTRRSLFTLKKGPAFFDLIVKPDGSMYEVSYSFKWERIAEAFEDYPELKRAIERELIKPEETPKLLEQYNQWYLEQDTATLAPLIKE